jgi:hypothetical protein
VLVLHAAPQSLDEYVADPATLAIHADANAGGVEHIGPRFAGELRALIGVDDLWCAVPDDCFNQRIDAEVRRAGTYASAQSVTISDNTAGAASYYTTDGTTPTTASARARGPISVARTTLKAIAVAAGDTNSVTGTANYTIN